MRIILQRVSKAEVRVDASIVGKIEKGYLLLVGIEAADQQEDIDWLAKKIINMRLFNDADGKMNLSISDVQGSILSISQFTLHASTKKGNRPSFIKAAPPVVAEEVYDQFNAKLEEISGQQVQKGIFGADMKVLLLNDGPVTIFLDSKNRT